MTTESPALSQDVIPHIETFAAIYNALGPSRIYSYRWDEALRDNFSIALAMRRDCYIYALMQERKLPTAKRKWTIEVDRPSDPRQKQVQMGINRVVAAIPHFARLRYYLLESIWFGRYGSQLCWSRCPNVQTHDGQAMWCIIKHMPVNGDKIQWEFDADVPGIYINAGTTRNYPSSSIRYADRAPVLLLNRPEWRRQFIIHTHEVDDSDYFEGEMAGAIGGVGLRSRIYWMYKVRTDLLTWALDAMSKSGTLGLLIFWYDQSNAQAKESAQKSATRASRDNILVLPRPAGKDGQTWGIDHIPASTGGVDMLHKMIAEYCDLYIQRAFVGQTLSSSTEGHGLGGTGVASMHADTKFQILSFDAENLDETLTQDLVKVAVALNYPWCDFPVRFRSIVADPENKDKLEGVKSVASLGVRFKEDEVRDLTGMSPPEPGDAEVCYGERSIRN